LWPTWSFLCHTYNWRCWTSRMGGSRRSRRGVILWEGPLLLEWLHLLPPRRKPESINLWPLENGLSLIFFAWNDLWGYGVFSCLTIKMYSWVFFSLNLWAISAHQTGLAPIIQIRVFFLFLNDYFIRFRFEFAERSNKSFLVIQNSVQSCPNFFVTSASQEVVTAGLFIHLLNYTCWSFLHNLCCFPPFKKRTLSGILLK